MKIIRFLSEDDRVLNGVFDPKAPDASRVIEGDIFNDIAVTGRLEKIKKILSPLTPVNILCLGLNYEEHAAETKVTSPERPVLFLKGTNSVVGPGSPIVLPRVAPDEVDYEAELAVVIGKKARNVSADEVETPDDLSICAVLNETVMQDSNTSNMIFDVSAIVSDLSQSMTLLPGTIILTGTPEGVGFTREPPVFLRDGDIITIEIEGVGKLVNPVRMEG